MYKVLLSSSKNPIPVENLEEVRLILQKIQEGNKLIVCRHGIFNPSFLIGIVFDEEAERQEAELKRLGYKTDRTSHFVELLSPKMKMLSNESRTEVEEQSSKEERKLK